MVKRNALIPAMFALGSTLASCNSGSDDSGLSGVTGTDDTVITGADNTIVGAGESIVRPGLGVSEGAMDTQLVAQAAAEHIDADWGILDLHVNESNTYGLEKLVTGIAELKPGQEIHPPHTHEEEEFLFVAEGTGTWTVEDQQFEAKKGDMLYAEPWKLHGVTNTSENPLTFYFFKWNNRGVAAPAESDVTEAMGAMLTSVIDQPSSHLIEDAWGSLNLYADGEATHGMDKMVTGIANILPSQEIHPPHAHEEEEFLYLVSGSGTWTINGEQVEATAGDLLYAKPHDLHGILNTGDTMLTFYFIKWNNKGVTISKE